MTFLQEANFRLERRLVEAAERKATQVPHGKGKAKAQIKRNNAAGENANDHLSNNNKISTRSDDGTLAPADNFWDVINRARGIQLDESKIFGD